MTLAEGAVGSIVHHQKRSFSLYAKVGDTYNVGMHQVSYGASFIEKSFHIFADHLSVQYFDGSSGLEIDVFAKVDFGKATLAKQVYEMVIA